MAKATTGKARGKKAAAKTAAAKKATGKKSAAKKAGGKMAAGPKTAPRVGARRQKPSQNQPAPKVSAGTEPPRAAAGQSAAGKDRAAEALKRTEPPRAAAGQSAAGKDRAAEALKRVEAARENKPTAEGLSIERIGVLGQVTWLMSQTATHKHMFISDLEWMVIPAIALGQFRLWRQGGLPVAYASWAYLSDEAAARAKEGVRRLAPIDWKSGENAVLMDLIAPFGGAEEVTLEIRKEIFGANDLNFVS